jgi:hypothetical protein
VRLRTAFLVLLALAHAALAAAQVAPPGPPGPFVIDLRGVTLGVPEDAAFYPELPAGTIVPARGFGGEVGGHVYVGQLGAARIGVGASLLRMRATSSPAEPAASSTSVPPPRTIPDVIVTTTMLAPQVSLNFGSARGWSYVGGGYGTAQVHVVTRGIPTVPDEEQDSGRVAALNVGAGARWFRSPHLAVGFDIRWYLVRATPGATLIAASVGISLK